MASPFVGTAQELDAQSRRGAAFTSDLHREYTLKFLVRVNDNRVGAAQVCGAPGIPGPFSPYITLDGLEFDPNARLVSLNAEHYENDRLLWVVTAGYSTKMPPGGIPTFTLLGKDMDGAQNNPTMVPPVIRWDSEEVTRARSRDLDGLPFFNAAGQPLTPAPVTEEGRAVLVVIRNELSGDHLDLTKFSREKITNYSFAVNSDTFVRAAPGTVRTRPPTAEQDFLGTLPFYRVTYRFVFNCRKVQEPVGGQVGAIGGSLVPKDGILTTRTADTVGTLTMSTGHGFVTGSIVTLQWVNGDFSIGYRYNVLIGTVATNSLPFTGGYGAILPAGGTQITVTGITVGSDSGEELETWQPAYLNQGLCQREENGGVPRAGRAVPIRGPSGHPITQPVLLDATGKELQPVAGSGTGADNPIRYIPTYINRRVYQSRLFVPLLAGATI